MSDPDLNPQFRRRWTEPAQQHVRGKDVQKRHRKPVDVLEETGRALRDDWRRGRVRRDGGGQ